MKQIISNLNSLINETNEQIANLCNKRWAIWDNDRDYSRDEILELCKLNQQIGALDRKKTLIQSALSNLETAMEINIA